MFEVRVVVPERYSRKLPGSGCAFPKNIGRYFSMEIVSPATKNGKTRYG